MEAIIPDLVVQMNDGQFVSVHSTPRSQKPHARSPIGTTSDESVAEESEGKVPKTSLPLTEPESFKLMYDD
jgi:hypothetical protein